MCLTKKHHFQVKPRQNCLPNCCIALSALHGNSRVICTLRLWFLARRSACNEIPELAASEMMAIFCKRVRMERLDFKISICLRTGCEHVLELVGRDCNSKVRSHSLRAEGISKSPLMKQKLHVFYLYFTSEVTINFNNLLNVLSNCFNSLLSRRESEVFCYSSALVW